MEITLAKIASWAGGIAAEGFEETIINSVATDTRTLTKNALYVSLRGENFNGDDFIETAFVNGAAAVMTTDGSRLKERPGVVVPDTLFSLGNLAHQYRWQGNLIPWVAITGSNGKSTTRSLLTHILSTQGAVCSPIANFNNLIGMPLTILQNTPATKFGVLEFGTNQRGEIYRLSEIAAPTIAGITNIGPAHLKGLGSLEGVAREKSDIFSRLPNDGLAIYPSQCDFINLFREKCRQVQQITFALEAHADVVAYDVMLDEQGSRFVVDGQQFFLPLLGRHNINNCLIALIAARRLGVSFTTAATALENFTPVARRLQVVKLPQYTLIDDAYNANPESVRAAARVLVDYSAERRVLILGDMNELGDASADLHREIGKWLSKLNIDVIFAVGKKMLALAESAQGQNARQVIRYFASVQSLLAPLKKFLHKNDVILVKGSHSMNLERVVSAILAFE